MNADRIERAVQRLEAALERIEAARAQRLAAGVHPASGSVRVVELINRYEKLREQVAESLRELDILIGRLEDEASNGHRHSHDRAKDL
jgi:hypothetical protein